MTQPTEKQKSQAGDPLGSTETHKQNLDLLVWREWWNAGSYNARTVIDSHGFKRAYELAQWAEKEFGICGWVSGFIDALQDHAFYCHINDPSVKETLKENGSNMQELFNRILK